MCKCSRGGAFAVDFTDIKGDDQKAVFKQDGNTFTYTTNTDDTFKGVDVGANFVGAGQKVIIDAKNNTITLKGELNVGGANLGNSTNNTKEDETWYNFEVNAKKLVVEGDGKGGSGGMLSEIWNTTGSNVINGDLELKNKASMSFINGNFGDIRGGGVLTLNGNFVADNAEFVYDFLDGANPNLAQFVINGNANIQNSKFYLTALSGSLKGIDSGILIKTKDGFNANFGDFKEQAGTPYLTDGAQNTMVSSALLDNARTYATNTLGIKTKSEYEYKDNTGATQKINILSGDLEFDYDDVLQYKVYLSDDKKTLYKETKINADMFLKDKDGKATTRINTALLDAQTKVHIVDSFIEDLNNKIINNGSFANVADLKAQAEAMKKEFEALKAELQKNVDEAKKLVASDVAATKNDEIAGLLADIGKASAAIDSAFGGNIVNDIISSTKSAASGTGGASATPNMGMSVSNDMALGNRLAVFSNPYENMKFAKELSKMRFASAGASDMRGLYAASAYNYSVWANVFGGANIIDGQSGGVYGVNVGVDGKVLDDSLFGVYLSYADSKIKDKLVSQESDNIQLGWYSRTFFGNHELDLKGYGQIAFSDQVRDGSSSDFSRKFLGLGASYGYVFDMSNDFYIKPLVGANLYYAHTPSYTETGGAFNQSVNSADSFNMSLELGAEFRKYMSDSSYIFATPKIEQYIVSSSDSHRARFIGDNGLQSGLFSIDGDNKKKTYGQLIVGGEMQVKEDLAINISLGAKQILAGKTDSKNETYLSGNLGVKYSF